MQDADRDSIASTPPVPPISIQTDPVVVLSTTEVTTPVQNVEIQQVEMAVVSAEEEAQVEPELPSMDVEENVFVDEPYEDVDMELEDEDEGLHPPISLGGLAVPVFDFGSDAAGQRDVDGRFELASRPLVVMSPVFSPGPSSAGASREGSVLAATPEAEQQQDEDEQEEEAETPPLGRFRVSSLAYLMDRNLTVSPPRSPVLLSSPASFEPQLRESEANVESTMFAAMQDVFVVKMRGMESELKARFVKHLEDQFGVRMDPGSEGEVVAEGAREVSWASLPENVVRQIMSEHRSDMDASSPSSSIVDDANTAMAVDCGALTEEFKQGSTAQLQHELDDQLHVFVDKLAEELAVPLQEALTAQLKNEIIVQVADQMLDALAVQGEEGEVEFEWRRRVLEQERWSGEDDGGDEEEEKEVIQHPLHHLFLGKAGTHGADFDMRILC
ncbi:hypothetical protein FB45DRAFT_167946 [Roridomyces roridus]|uniref:Uncharacterized protein n=1 Tax=Roridomyces roridus TaxID=1738132 RepID=A0AAD7BEH6_9AGAR|nr:hypothetical protein FB45DRAFT_167946 [Roridomyces roridus]